MYILLFRLHTTPGGFDHHFFKCLPAFLDYVFPSMSSSFLFLAFFKDLCTFYTTLTHSTLHQTVSITIFPMTPYYLNVCLPIDAIILLVILRPLFFCHFQRIVYILHYKLYTSPGVSDHCFFQMPPYSLGLCLPIDALILNCHFKLLFFVFGHFQRFVYVHYTLL